MENKRIDDFMESSLPNVFAIPGEPAIVLHKLPPGPSSEASFIDCAIHDSQSERSAGPGKWLEGRDVRKLFGKQYFTGKVVQFDEEVGWYRVEYEDGDFEDLEWQELMDVLLPLDVNIPLKTLAMKIIKATQKSGSKSVTRKTKT